MIAIFVFFVSMLVYLMTIAPTLSFFDSGEMIAGAYTLGVAHPPGYPVYVTLGKLFTYLPFGNVAFRINLMSSFFAAMTSVMIYYITRAMLDDSENERFVLFKRLKFADIAGVLSALAFSFSYNLWAWAVVSKFYTLNAFVVACILMLLIRWRRARMEEGSSGGSHSLAYLYTIAFISGIAGVVHISQFVLWPMYLLYILIVDGSVFYDFKDLLKPGSSKSPWALLQRLHLKTILIMLFFLALGHTLYLHVPLRASRSPLINWGTATDWTQFKWVYNREGYPTVGGERSWSLLWKQMQSFNLVREFTWAGIPIILLGLWGHFKKDWRHFTILVFGSVFMVAAIVIGGNPVEENIFLLQQFYIPVYIFLCIIMGGAIYVALKVRPKNIIIATVVLLVVIAYPATELKAHYWENDRSDNFIAYDMGNAELNFSPEFAVLFTWGDSGAFPMWYLQDVERKRPDVLLVHTPHLPLAWFLNSINREPDRLGDVSQIQDYRWLRNYNGLKGIPQLLAIPDDFRDPADLIKQITVLNPARQFCFDYSSRYSIDMPFDVLPYAITYQKFRKDFVDTNQRDWAYLVTRGLPNPTIALDLDETKAVTIYGYTHADLGKKYQEMGLPALAQTEFVKAVQFAPELWDSLSSYIK
ncbi:MAG: DUF2723 domain-containing protein [Nitrospirota bacterium]